MEKMNVQIFNRDFSATGPGRLELRVDGLRWVAMGGPAEARISGQSRDVGWSLQAAQWARDVLRRPVEMHNEYGEKTWWGYVQRVEVRRAGLSLAYDLHDMANRVCVEYWQRQPQLEWTGVKTFTPWVDDPDSQRIYGVKERIFRLGSLDELEALLARDTLLARHAHPQARITSLPAPDPGLSVQLECRGWWETMNWKIARFDDGYEGFTLPGQLTQSLGRSSSSDIRVAQSFTTAAGGWKVGEAVVNLRVTGLNSDDVHCELCADAAGVPGTVLASSDVSAAAISGGRGWVRFVFSNRPQIAANTACWLVFSRTGVYNPTNYYLFYSDTTDSYPNGKVMVWNGSAWLDASSGMADINFYVVGYTPRLTRLMELTALDMGGQFLSSAQVNTAVSGDTLFWREGVLTCGAELANLLDSGEGSSRLLARVDTERRLVIDAAPAEQEWLFSLDSLGELRARSGRLALSSDQPVGQRLLLAGGWEDKRVLIEELEWTPEQGLQVKWNHS